MTDKKIIAYKGFDTDFKCRGFQYTVGETYTHKGHVEPCESGFHSCANPWDVLDYYDITSRFAIVIPDGEIKTHGKDSKIASEKLKIENELKLPDFIAKCIDYIKKPQEDDSGDYSKLASSGDYSRLASSGDYSKLASSGHSSKLASSGYSSKLASSGHSSQLASSGDYSKLASSGDYSQLASSGYSSKLASSGYSSQLASSGDYSQLASSGDYSRLASSGESSIIACSGINSKVKGGKNCALSLSRWVEHEKRYRITVAYVGENGIKQDTWYTLDDDGNFVECE